MYSLFQLQVDQDKGEFAISKDVDVQLWMDYRAQNKLPSLVERLGSFVIVTNELFEQFEQFKKDMAILQGFSMVEENELLSYWMK